MNVITGLPRAGTTLLCNILNQNDNFYASSTSALCEIVAGISRTVTGSMEITSDLLLDGNNREEVIKKSTRAFCESWYEPHKINFDKSRGWSSNLLLLRQLFPKSVALVCVRDPRDVFASIEKQHRKTAIFDGAMSPIEKTVLTRANQFMAPDGMIGLSILGVEDMVRRAHKNVQFVKFEDFAQDPELVMRRIYKKLSIDYFEHGFKDVKDTSEDADELYRNKFPHKGSGYIKPVDSKWQDYMDQDLGNNILAAYPYYCKVFGYQ